MKNEYSINVSFRKIAQTLARDLKVVLTWGGHGAHTDGRHLNLPTVLPGTMVESRKFDYLLGCLYHEVSHHVWSDVAALIAEKKKDLLSGQFANLFEDVRVENLFIQKYPGSKYHLDILEEELSKEAAAEERIKAPGQEAEMEAATKEIYKAAWQHRGWYGLRKDKKTPPHLVPITELVKREMPKLASSRDAIVLGREVADLFRKMFPNYVTPIPPPTSTVEEFLKWLAEAGKAEAGKAEAGSKGLIEDPVWVLAELLPMTDALNQELADLNKGQPKVKWGEIALPPLDTTGDEVFVAKGSNSSIYQAERDRLGGDLSALKKATAVFLKSRAKKSWEKGLEEGVLDEASLWKIRTGEHKRLFKEKRESDLVNTAVQVMVDVSGSMNQGDVRQAAVLLNEVVSAVPKVKLCIGGFETSGYSGIPAKVGFGRREFVSIPLYKTWDEPSLKARGRIGAIRCGGGTPLGDAYAYGFENLASRKERKRVLVIVSDGDSAYSCADNSHSDPALMKEIHRKATARRIQVIGIQIGGHSSIGKYVDSFVKIHSADELPDCVLRLVKGLAETEIMR